MALAAGSGGIRWNSETNYIQLADENKNWINYKKFNPNRYYIFKSGEIQNTTWNVYQERASVTPVTVNNNTIQIGINGTSYAYLNIVSNNAFDTTIYRYIDIVYSCTNDNLSYTYLKFGIPAQIPTSSTTPSFIVSKPMVISTAVSTYTLDLNEINMASAYFIFSHSSNGAAINAFSLSITEIYLYN